MEGAEYGISTVANSALSFRWTWEVYDKESAALRKSGKEAYA